MDRPGQKFDLVESQNQFSIILKFVQFILLRQQNKLLYIKVLLQIMQEHENVEKTRIPSYLVQNKWFSFRALKANMNLKGTLQTTSIDALSGQKLLDTNKILQKIQGAANLFHVRHFWPFTMEPKIIAKSNSNFQIISVSSECFLKL